MSGQETVLRESGEVNRQSFPAQPSRPRMLFIDNLRWTMIILVISMHAADTYSPLGNWYFEDRRPLSAAALLTFATWQMYLQSFFMGLLFFIAGYFAPASLDRKGRLQFVRERAFRLGLPVLFYMFVLGQSRSTFALTPGLRPNLPHLPMSGSNTSATGSFFRRTGHCGFASRC